MSVNDRCRDVRLSSEAPIRVSKRAMAFETVALDRPRSAAALEKEPVSATLAKTAQASRSGRRDITDPETMSFHGFPFFVRKPARSWDYGSERPTPARSAT